MTQSISTEETTQDPLVASAARGRTAWQRLGLRLRSVTPSQVVQFLLGAGVLAGLGWLAWTARIALLPFVLGAALAYIMLPIVNFFDRFLPRWFASLLTMGTVTAVIVYMLVLSIPLIARQVYNVSLEIPTEADLEVYVDELTGYVDTLPPIVQNLVRNWLETAVGTAREQLNVYAERGVQLAIDTVLGLFNALGFVFGFLVIPTWLLTVLNEQKKGTAAVDRMLPDAVQKDFWALIRIADRSFSTFVRGQFFIGVIVGALTYLGLSIIIKTLNLGTDYTLVLSIFSGFMALIPILGPILGSVPVIFLGFTISNEAGIAALIMYVLIWLFVNGVVTPNIEERLVSIHPAVLVIVIVAVSELGFLWVLLAAPLVGLLRDTFVYVNGRFAEPPRPAGLLPHEPLPPAPTSTQPQRVPIAYRRGRAQRSAVSRQ
jgi:predicted PurR-regulated permease PerM